MPSRTRTAGSRAWSEGATRQGRPTYLFNEGRAPLSGPSGTGAPASYLAGTEAAIRDGSLQPAFLIDYTTVGDDERDGAASEPSIPSLTRRWRVEASRDPASSAGIGRLK